MPQSVCSILLSSINGSIAWFVKPSVDNLVLLKNKSFLVFLPVGVLLLFSLKGFFSFANNFLMSSIGAKIVKSLRKQFFEKMLFLPLSFYARESSGSVISRVMNDVSILEGLIANTTKNFFVYSTTVFALWLRCIIQKSESRAVVFYSNSLNRLRLRQIGREDEADQHKDENAHFQRHPYHS